MTYTTHGYMTAADLADMRDLYDLDLCACCEGDQETVRRDEYGQCRDCDHDH